jgi:mono/diheme cytochrome c family protein
MSVFSNIVAAALLALCAAGLAGARAGTPAAPGAAHAAAAEGNFRLLDDYCSKCHNATDWAGGLAFDTLSHDAIGDDAKVWEETVRKMRGRLMPPPGEKQPGQAVMDQFVSWMEGRLDTQAADRTDPGAVGLHRINRTEYARVVQELLGLRVNPETLLPKDTKSEGFDNVANVLRVSPTFLDQYISAARTVSVLAVGDPKIRSASATYRAPPMRQSAYQEGMPLGSRGGLSVEHWFPADGDYEFNLRVPVGGGYGLGMAEQRVVFLIDGRKVFEQTVGGEEDSRAVDQQQAPAQGRINARFQKIRLPVKAGPRRLVVTFIATTYAESESLFAPFVPGGGDNFARVAAIDVIGPYNATGISDTPSRRKIFSCRPATQAEEAPCARHIIARIARQAFRRPVNDADLAAPLRFFDEGRGQGDFETGIQTAIMAILSSPKFLYRLERAPADARPGEVYGLDGLAIATRLAFFLWSQGPDDALLELASTGRLKDPAVLDQQVRRMLGYRRSDSLITNFANQWLNIEGLDNVDPDPVLFPNFDEDLRRGYRREIELFVGNILREDRPVTELLTANYSFLNERLALHYGVPNVRGDQFRKVQLTDSRRWGLLGKGAMLMATSYGNRTAPVLRGNWILERITGTPPAAPPPGVEALKDNQPGQKATTVRERLEMHRQKPSCNACHGVMDPLGFALENFDAIGAWRDKDRESLTLIDASSELAGGRKIRGPDQLREALVSRPEQFAQTLTEKLMIFALGRVVEYRDMPRIRAIVRDAAAQDYRFSALISGIVRSEQFQKSRVPDEAPAAKPVLAQAANQAR